MTGILYARDVVMFLCLNCFVIVQAANVVNYQEFSFSINLSDDSYKNELQNVQSGCDEAVLFCDTPDFHLQVIPCVFFPYKYKFIIWSKYVSHQRYEGGLR